MQHGPVFYTRSFHQPTEIPVLPKCHQPAYPAPSKTPFGLGLNHCIVNSQAHDVEKDTYSCYPGSSRTTVGLASIFGDYSLDLPIAFSVFANSDFIQVTGRRHWLENVSMSDGAVDIMPWTDSPGGG